MYKEDIDKVISNNNLLKNKNYITKSNINRKTLREMHIPDCVTIKEARESFDECEHKLIKTGIPFNEKKQRHTKLASRYELYRKIIKGR